jgi:hypothetical protein
MSEASRSRCSSSSKSGLRMKMDRAPQRGEQHRRSESHPLREGRREGQQLERVEDGTGSERVIDDPGARVAQSLGARQEFAYERGQRRTAGRGLGKGDTGFDPVAHAASMDPALTVVERSSLSSEAPPPGLQATRPAHLGRAARHRPPRRGTPPLGLTWPALIRVLRRSGAAAGPRRTDPDRRARGPGAAISGAARAAAPPSRRCRGCRSGPGRERTEHVSKPS